MLEVKCGAIETKREIGRTVQSEWGCIGYRKCWYVRVIASDSTAAIPVEFSREVDANMAMKALVEIDNWEGTMLEIRKRIYGNVSIAELKKRMTENLAW